MKKYIASSFIMALALVALPPLCPASTFQDFQDSFVNETKPAFLDGAITLYGLDVNNGTTLLAEGTPILNTGPLSLDIIGIHPTDAGRTGTVSPGVSVHFDRILKTIFPDATSALRALAPSTSDQFLPKLVFTFNPAYNLNAQANEHALMLNFFTGLYWKWGK